MTPPSEPSLLHVASPSHEWWRTAVFYQVYPRSFADADGDGVGDLPGITSRLPYLAELGVDAVWLSPFYRSPQRDAGYDVADYRQVDDLFGTLDDADALVAEAHRVGLRVIVDLVPNHTSDAHEWFQAALAAAPGGPERARYIFRDGTDGAPPNNWESIFGGSAWTRVADRGDAPGSSWQDDDQWYLHLFDASQPDLDWDHPEVRQEFLDIIAFWLDRGIDGFRVDVAHGLVKAPGLPDWAGHTRMVEGDTSSEDVAEEEQTDDSPMFDQEGVHEIYRSWRGLVESYDGERILVAEAWVSPLSRLARYVRPDEMHQAFNFGYLTTRWRAPELRRTIAESYRANDAVGAPTTWVLSNHDVIRHASRFGMGDTGKGPNGIGADDPQPDAELGLRRARAATLLMLALPGSAYVYQGEELGLPEHTTLPDDAREDPAFHRTGGAEKGRDGCRVPLPWRAAEPAFGFSPTGEAWLPQPAEWAAYAVDAQEGRDGTTLELYREALRRRRELRLAEGAIALAEGWQTDDEVVALRCSVAGSPLLIIANLGAQPVVLPEGSRVVLASGPLSAAGEVPTDTTVWAHPAQ